MIKQIIAIILLIMPSVAFAEESLWINAGGSATPLTYHKIFSLDFTPDKAYIKYTCHTAPMRKTLSFTAFVNAAATPKAAYWKDVQYINASKILNLGRNSVEIEVSPTEYCPQLPIICKIFASGKDSEGNDKSVTIYSDETWTYTHGRYTGLNTDLSDEKTVKLYTKPIPKPLVLPKISTTEAVPVTAIRLTSGNAGSVFDFETLKDHSDKFYILKQLGVNTIESYIYGQTNRQPNGEWFWGYEKQIEHSLTQQNMNMSLYPWTWLVPEYNHSANKITCITHDEEGAAYSIWDSEILDVNESFYADMKKNIKTDISELHPSIFGDFGECHYPAGWNTWLIPAPKHQHPDFWAGDKLAKADFKQKMLEKYTSYETLNTAWELSLTDNDDIPYPSSSSNMRHRVDFVNWYYNSMTKHVVRICEIAKKYYPTIPISPKLGCDDENPMWGQDCSAIVKELAKIGAGVCSTHSGNFFALKRISSACKLYKSALETETAGYTTRETALDRIFTDATNGVKGTFEYPDSLMIISDIFSQNQRYLTGEYSETDTALFFPQACHRASLNDGYPKKLKDFALALRDVTDFDIIDENMIIDGALKNYKTLVIESGSYIEQSVFNIIEDSRVKLIINEELLPIKNIEGKPLTFTESDVYKTQEQAFELIPSPLSKTADGVCSAIVGSSVLYMNTTSNTAGVSENIPEDFCKAHNIKYSPKQLAYKLEIPPYSIRAQQLDKAQFETIIECEDVANEAKREAVYRSACGASGTCVRLSNNESIAAKFNTTQKGEYAVCVMGQSLGGYAKLRIDGREIATVCEASIPQNIYKICTKITLNKGEHKVSILSVGNVTVDKIIVTNNLKTDGYSYPFTLVDDDGLW